MCCRFFRNLILVALVALASGCDLFREERIDRVEVSDSVPDMRLQLLGDPQHLYLPDYFEHNRGASLDYLARTESDVLELVVQLDTLSIYPQTTGEARVRVEAWDMDGTRTGDDFTVIVEGCPPEPAEGMVLYFPIQLGSTWSFDVRSHYKTWESYNQWKTDVEGQMTWRFVDLECLRDTVAVFIDESFSGTAKTTQTYPDYVAGEPTDTTWSVTHRGILTRDGLILPGYTQTPDLKWKRCYTAGSSATMNLAWQYSAGSPDTVAVEQLFHAGFGAYSEGRAHLVKDTGLTHWSLSCPWREGSYGISVDRR